MQAVKKSPGSFIPFSIGERQCPGQKFAMAEASIFFSHFLTKFDFEIAEGDEYQLKFTQRFLREPLVSYGLRIKKLS
jgi:cytochrome P450